MARYLIPFFGSRRVVLAGLVATAAGAALLGVLTWPPLSPWAGLLTITVGAGLMFAAATVAAAPVAAASVAATSDVPTGQAGTVGAVLNTVMELGATLGLAVLPSAETHSPRVRMQGPPARSNSSRHCCSPSS